MNVKSPGKGDFWSEKELSVTQGFIDELRLGGSQAEPRDSEQTRGRNFRWEEKRMKEVSKTPGLQAWETHRTTDSNILQLEVASLAKRWQVWFGKSWVSSDGKTIQRECQSQRWKSQVRTEAVSRPHHQMGQTNNSSSLTSDNDTNTRLLGKHGDCPLWRCPKNIQNALSPQ